ncbi:MAG: DUF4962 domain-containing protein [Pyrinomonadaceae bacterium]|nr:DUF4962 domain-containing protein [Pyrinomonadaceae bacterium]
MNKSVNDNIFLKHIRSSKCIVTCLLVIVLFHVLAFSQTQSKSDPNKTSVPAFTELLAKPVKFKPELQNVHPRLFFTSKDLPSMRERAKGADRALWQEVLKTVEGFGTNVPDVNEEDLYKSGLAERKNGVMTQYSLAFRTSQFSFAYLIEGDEKYLDQAKRLTMAACDMPIWGYKTNKPNVDLPPAHLLYAVAFAYDTLFDKLTSAEKRIIKEKLIKQSRLMYEYFKYKEKKRYTYTQNHTWIPMASLAIASYALMDETPEAQDWARLSRAVFDRTMLAFGTDGYFYESFHYFGFAFRWMILYFDAHLAATGENLYTPMKSKFENMKYFVMHSILPDRENIFDFADIGDGSLDRNRESRREKTYGEYDILYRFAEVYRDSQAQTVGDFIRKETDLGTREPMWAFINHDPKLEPAPLSKIPTKIHFVDNDTVFGRTDWTINATAFAFRSSPPEGHFAAQLASKIPDWRQNTGHAHPDANSFIIFANGKYLTGDTGYLGIKQTDDHNTILVNGRGQANDGVYEMFKEVPNEKLDKIRIADISLTKDYFYIRGEAASAYYDDLKLKKFDRHFLYVNAGNYFIVWDELETEKPSEFTFLLNADKEIEISGNQAHLINEDAALRVIRISPAEANSKVVPQMIQARGLPGSVSEGVSEQRGVQLQTTSAVKEKKFEFLHFLQPVVVGSKTPAPKFEKTANGLKIIWANGNEDVIDFQDTKQMLVQNGK